MQRMWATIMLALIMILSISIQTNGNEKRNDLAHAPSTALALAPQSEDGLLPNPLACVGDVKTIPNCVKAITHFRFREVTKKCCTIVVSLPEDCFGIVFHIPFFFRWVLKIICKIISHT
ncbi:hypothetical protein EUTSA_v10003095mg [Eutrema salsugineum]|uniref:Prolamin-like domain-containing protein n=1 Tax=Eutrema salsugineum TaxID=72664 RepID=V4KI59_EUTSA|nr:uncharacterized protein LOC18013525 [Eutrema salsugineum]ESQ37490.1 hypothetical protein EUTSA_v10003095mg [Eutrema salsugineum]